MIYTCIVPNCGNTSDQWNMVPFPRPSIKEIYNIWLDRIQGPDMKSEVLSGVARRNVVCENHFSTYCRIEDTFGNVTLKKGSLPTIAVPGFSEKSTPENSLLKRRYWTNLVHRTRAIGVNKHKELNYAELESLGLLEQCMLCRTKEETLKYYNISSTRIKRTESFLNILERIVGCRIDVKVIHTTCSRCRDIVIEYYDAQNRLIQIQDILMGYVNNQEEAEVEVSTVVKTEKMEDYLDNPDASSMLEVNIMEDQRSESDGIVDDFEQQVTAAEKPKKLKKLVKKRFREPKLQDNQTECDVCHKKFARTTTLKQHMLIHGPNKPFVCEVCGKFYRHKGALKIHLGMHNGINPFTCEYCNKSFTQKIALMRHIPMHTGEAPHVCDLCGKRFIHRTSFRIHKLNHAGQKDYKCHICNFAFLSRSHLNRHLKRHTGEKNFACHVCGRRFAERYNLMCHQKMHASQELEKPPELGEVFKIEVLAGSNQEGKVDNIV